MTDLLLTHGYRLASDGNERKVMKPYPPLGILSLAAYMKRRGFGVSVFDATFEPEEAFVERLNRERPTVVGLYCTLMTKRAVLSMLRQAKARGASVVLGGPEPASYAEEYLLRGADAVVFGEGELSLEELVPALGRSTPGSLAAVRGIAYRDEEGRVVRTEPRQMIADLDALPYPDRDAADMEPYLRAWREHHGGSSLSLICARGCPYHCDWCSHAVYGNSHRRRSPGNVAREVGLLWERYRPDQLWYADDVFTIQPSWTVAFAAELERRGLRIPFECISRADRLDEEVVAVLARMGCRRIWIGSESGSQRILDAMRRGVRLEQVQAVARLCRRRGIEVGMFLMMGYEGEDETDLRATVEHLKKASPDTVLTTVAYPIKGTGYYEKVKDRIVSRSDWEDRTDRDFNVAGRHSKRYYRAASRWMQSELGFHRELVAPAKSLGTAGRLLKHGTNWVRGRVGMALASREVES